MRREQLLSVGIDVGTSTTQCVFSRLCLADTAPAFALPKVSITEKTVLHRCPTHLTPMLSDAEIDAEHLRTLIEADYRAAGVLPADVRCGALIVTGETARKRNARAVSQALSELAGDFVVAAAGPDLEGILAGRGSGAAELSREQNKRVLNLDVGGGTTNMCLFDAGEVVETGNLDVGGRLLRFAPGTSTVAAYSPKLAEIAADAGVELAIGRALDERELDALTARVARVVEEAVNLRQRTALYDRLVLERGFSPGLLADAYTFSGGVGACVYGDAAGELAFDDVGERLGAAMRSTACFREGRVLRPKETRHATVIGAGAYSMTVSGSTIQYGGVRFPVKNLPVGRIRFSEPADIPRLRERALEQRRVLGSPCGIAFDGLEAPTFAQIEAAADALAGALADAETRVLVMERDMAKALGQALGRRLPGLPLVCVDGVSIAHGELFDIGAPLADGRVLPVVVKTFAFSS